MSSERAYKARGIVLRARNLGEADKIYTLFTVERGKLDAVGKGARRQQSRLAGRLEFTSEVALTLHRGRSLDIITGASIVREHWSAIVDPAAFATAHLLVELVDLFTEADLAQPEVYALLRAALHALGATAEPALLVPRFALRLLGALGFAPVCDACVRCGTAFGTAFGTGAAYADLDAGGLACERCRPHRADALALAAADVANFQGLAARREDAVRPALGATNAAARAVDAFVTWHLGKRPKSARLLATLAHA